MKKVPEGVNNNGDAKDNLNLIIEGYKDLINWLSNSSRQTSSGRIQTCFHTFIPGDVLVRDSTSAHKIRLLHTKTYETKDQQWWINNIEMP